MLEVLAPHAAAAFQNARLLEAERGAARAAGALLQLSQALTASAQRSARSSRTRSRRCRRSSGARRRGVRARRRPATSASIQLHAMRGTHRSPAGGDRRRATDARRDLARERARRRSSCPHRSSTQVPDEYLVMSRSPATSSSCPLQWEPEQIGRADRGRPTPREPAVRRRGSASGARRRRPHGARARQRPADQRARALPPAGGEPGRDLLGGRRRRPRASRSSAGRLDVLFARRRGGLARRAVGQTTSPDADRSLAVAEVRRAIADGTDVERRSTGSAATAATCCGSAIS